MLESAKSSQAFRTISEVSDDLGVPQHVLRFWETKFSAIRPLKRGGNRRYYRPEDIQLLRAVNKLLYTDGYTIRGVQKLIREQGVREIASLHGGVMPVLTDTSSSAVAEAEDGSRVAGVEAGFASPIIDVTMQNTPKMEFEPLPNADQPALFLPTVERQTEVISSKPAPEIVVHTSEVVVQAPEPVVESKPSADVSDAIARLQAVRAQIQTALGHGLEQVA
jgi:DNA-binding transcriptional MerR regulator